MSITTANHWAAYAPDFSDLRAVVWANSSGPASAIMGASDSDAYGINDSGQMNGVMGNSKLLTKPFFGRTAVVPPWFFRCRMVLSRASGGGINASGQMSAGYNEDFTVYRVLVLGK